MDDLWDHHPSPLDRLPSDAAEIFSRCEAPLRALLVALHREPTHLIHADLHGGNVRFLLGHRVGILDFDDCGLGHPAQDVAICAFYLRTQPNAQALLAALREGYTSVRPWPAAPEQLEALVVARALTLCAGLLAHPDPALHAWLDRVLPRWTRLASGWLAGGVD